MPDKYLYVIAAAQGPVKIGHSSNPTRRLRQLQTGHPMALQVHHSRAIAADSALIIERLIHQANRHRCLKGEWFNLTVNEAVAEIEFAIITYSENPMLRTIVRHRLF